MYSDSDIELPGEVLKHVEIAEKFLVEGKELIDKDPVQASEKLYKAAEETVKALALASTYRRLGRLPNPVVGGQSSLKKLLKV